MRSAKPLVTPTLLGYLPGSVRRLIRWPVIRWRHRVLEPEDAYLSHYPKSGSTWLRFLIAALAEPELDPDFRNVNAVVPPVGATGANRRLPFGGRLFTSHDPLGDHVGRGRPVIYLVRDPRDVCASYFAHACRQDGDSKAFQPFAEAFLAGEVANYGTWIEHTRRAISLGHRSDMLIVRYEDLLADTRSALVPVATKLGLPTAADHLDAAIDRCSRERMRSVEHTSDGRPSTQPFVRRPTDRRWPELATPRLEEQFVATMSSEMEAFGYGG